MARTPPHPGPHPAVEAETQRQKTALLFRNSGIAQLVHVVNATLLAYVNVSLHASASVAFTWSALVVAIAAGRYLLARRFRATGPDPAAAVAWRRSYLAATATLGAVWGAVPVLFMWNAPDGARLFNGLVLAGMVAGAVPLLASVPVAIWTFAALVAVPMALVMFLQASSALHWAFGSMSIVFLASMLVSARYLHETLDTAIRLGLEQRRLAQDLERAGRAADAALAERERLEEETRRERDFAESLIDTAQAIVLVLDTEGRIVRFNRYLEEISGHRLDDVRGASWFTTFLPSQDRAEGRKRFERAIAETPTRASITPIMSRRGAEILVEWHDKTLKDSAGLVTGLLAVGQDVTLREKSAESQRLLKAAVEQSNSSIVVTDVEGSIIFVNSAFTHTTGYAPEEAIGQNPRILKSGRVPRETYQELWGTIASGRPWHGELCNRTKGGEFYWEAANISPVFDAHGGIANYVAVMDDITVRKQAEADIARLSEWNELLLNSAGEGIYGADQEGNCTFVNPAALALLGFDKEEVLGKNAHATFHDHRKDGTPYPPEECPVSLTHRDGVRRAVEDAFVRKDGEVFPVHLSVTPMHEHGKIVGVAVVFQDIARRKALELELTRLATTDPLTGVANRRRLVQELELELARAERFGLPAAFLMVDVDHFKSVNDTHGHAVGDAVLRHLAELARRRLRGIDLFGRLGGEEFGILLPGTDGAGALQCAESLRRHVAESPLQTGTGAIPFTISIGLTVFEPGDDAPDRVLARADVALYRAKEGGRNRVEVA